MAADAIVIAAHPTVIDVDDVAVRTIIESALRGDKRALDFLDQYHPRLARRVAEVRFREAVARAAKAAS